MITNGKKFELWSMAAALALGSSSANAGEVDAVKWVTELGLDISGGSTIRTVTLNNGNTVTARANEGLVFNVGGVIANGKNSPFETQFTLGYKFDIVTSGEPAWYSIPLEVIESYSADTLRTGLGLSYHMNSKLEIAGKTTDRFDNAFGLVAIVGWVPKFNRFRYSGPIRQDRNQSSLSWYVRPSRGELYSIDLRYTFIKYQPSNAPNTGKINGNSLGIYFSFRY